MKIKDPNAFIVSIIFIILLILQLRASFLYVNVPLYHLAIALRFSQLLFLLILFYLSLKKYLKYGISLFFMYSMFIQIIASKIEGANSLIAFNFIAIFNILLAVNFRDSFQNWLLKWLPVSVFPYLISLSFKNSSLYSTPALFFDNFMFVILGFIVSSIIVKFNSDSRLLTQKLKLITEEQDEVIKKQAKKLATQKVREELLQIATQVAHDIRSPLAALGGVIKNLKLPDNDPNKKILESVTARINGIAEDLLASNRDPSKLDQHLLQEVSPIGLIEEVVAEKQLQFGSEIKIIFKNSTGHNFKTKLDPVHFGRLLSNLINNSAEAMNNRGEIRLNLSLEQDEFKLTITDQGPGIPAEILNNLGKRGNTTKSTGNGLGIYHAKNSIEQWNGHFEVNSSSAGTTIIITIPVTGITVSTATPVSNTTDIIYNSATKNITDNNSAVQKSVDSMADSKFIVLLDDDQLMHMTWEVKATRAGFDFRAFATPAELFAELDTLPEDTIFYIDSSLGDEQKGEDIARSLYEKGYTNLYLTTGYEPERFKDLTFLKGVIGKEAPF